MDKYIIDIKEILAKYNCLYIAINDSFSIKKIRSLLVDNNIYEPSNVTEIHYLGWYYEYIEKDYVKMKRYYLMAVDKGDPNAMNNLGLYYENIEKDYVKMKRYYLMAIDKGNSNAMTNLGWYYKNIEKEYDLMKKYYLMAIDNGCSKAMSNLGVYYSYTEKNYDLMKRYFLMAITNGNSNAMCNLGTYYFKIEKNYDKMKRYYLMAINKGNSYAMRSIVQYYKANNLWTEKIIDFHQHNIEITEEDITEMFTKYKMIYYILMNLIRIVISIILYFVNISITEMFTKYIIISMILYFANISITEYHIIKIFRLIDDKLMNLIRTVDLRSYKNCPKHIKSMQNNYVRCVRNELDVCVKCPKSLIDLTIDFIMISKT